MPWTRLEDLPCETWQSKSTAKARGKLQARIAALKATRAAIDAEAEAFVRPGRQQSDMTPAEREQRDAIERRRRAALEAELKLRNDLTGWYAKRVEEGNAERKRGRDDLLRVRPQIEQQLWDSGLVIVNEAMIRQHPLYQSARARAATMPNLPGTWGDFNRAALVTLDLQLNGRRHEKVLRSPAGRR